MWPRNAATGYRDPTTIFVESDSSSSASSGRDSDDELRHLQGLIGVSEGLRDIFAGNFGRQHHRHHASLAALSSHGADVLTVEQQQAQDARRLRREKKFFRERGALDFQQSAVFHVAPAQQAPLPASTPARATTSTTAPAVTTTADALTREAETAEDERGSATPRRIFHPGFDDDAYPPAPSTNIDTCVPAELQPWYVATNALPTAAAVVAVSRVRTQQQPPQHRSASSASRARDDVTAPWHAERESLRIDAAPTSAAVTDAAVLTGPMVRSSGAGTTTVNVLRSRVTASNNAVGAGTRTHRDKSPTTAQGSGTAAGKHAKKTGGAHADEEMHENDSVRGVPGSSAANATPQRSGRTANALHDGHRPATAAAAAAAPRAPEMSGAATTENPLGAALPLHIRDADNTPPASHQPQDRDEGETSKATNSPPAPRLDTPAPLTTSEKKSNRSGGSSSNNDTASDKPYRIPPPSFSSPSSSINAALSHADPSAPPAPLEGMAAAMMADGGRPPLRAHRYVEQPNGIFIDHGAHAELLARYALEAELRYLQETEDARRARRWSRLVHGDRHSGRDSRRDDASAAPNVRYEWLYDAATYRATVVSTLSYLQRVHVFLVSLAAGLTLLTLTLLTLPFPETRVGYAEDGLPADLSAMLVLTLVNTSSGLRTSAATPMAAATASAVYAAHGLPILQEGTPPFALVMTLLQPFHAGLFLCLCILLVITGFAPVPWGIAERYWMAQRRRWLWEETQAGAATASAGSDIAFPNRERGGREPPDCLGDTAASWNARGASNEGQKRARSKSDHWPPRSPRVRRTGSNSSAPVRGGALHGGGSPGSEESRSALFRSVGPLSASRYGSPTPQQQSAYYHHLRAALNGGQRPLSLSGSMQFGNQLHMTTAGSGTPPLSPRSGGGGGGGSPDSYRALGTSMTDLLHRYWDGHAYSPAAGAAGGASLNSTVPGMSGGGGGRGVSTDLPSSTFSGLSLNPDFMKTLNIASGVATSSDGGASWATTTLHPSHLQQQQPHQQRQRYDRRGGATKRGGTAAALGAKTSSQHAGTAATTAGGGVLPAPLLLLPAITLEGRLSADNLFSRFFDYAERRVMQWICNTCRLIFCCEGAFCADGASAVEQLQERESGMSAPRYVLASAIAAVHHAHAVVPFSLYLHVVLQPRLWCVVVALALTLVELAFVDERSVALLWLAQPPSWWAADVPGATTSSVSLPRTWLSATSSASTARLASTTTTTTASAAGSDAALPSSSSSAATPAFPVAYGEEGGRTWRVLMAVFITRTIAMWLAFFLNVFF